jgi:hypothetical protein
MHNIGQHWTRGAAACACAMPDKVALCRTSLQQGVVRALDGAREAHSHSRAGNTILCPKTKNDFRRKYMPPLCPYGAYTCVTCVGQPKVATARGSLAQSRAGTTP